MLCAAPVAIPAAVKAAVSAPAIHGARLSVGGIAGATIFAGEDNGGWTLLDDWQPNPALTELLHSTPVWEETTMSDFADDVQRYLTPEQQASSLLFADSRFVPMHRDDRNLIEPGTGGKRVSFNEVVERYRTRIKRGEWMQTATGRAFYPLDPQPEEIHIEDIAAALSKLCRYGGHCKRFYSVAEHCVLMAHVASPSVAFEALMHDASEAYLSDVIRPVKSSLPEYRAIEERLEAVIARRFDLVYPLPAEVKRIDNAILADECDQAMATPPQDWCLPEPPLGVTLQFWSPDKAEYEFLSAYKRLHG